MDISANVNIRNKIKFYLNWSFYFIFVLVAYVNQKRTRRYVELNKCHHITYTLFQRNHWNHLSFKTCICLIMPSSSISLLSYYHHKDNKRMVCLWCSNSVPYKRKSVSFTVRGFCPLFSLWFDRLTEHNFYSCLFMRQFPLTWIHCAALSCAINSSKRDAPL